MVKTSFELEILAETLTGATAIAEEKIADFLGISTEQVQTTVDVEFKVKSKDDGLVVIVYGSLKRGLSNLTPR